LKKLFLNIILISLPTLIILVLVLELFFRFVIPSNNPPQTIFSKEDLLYKYKPNQLGLFSIGKFAQIRSNYRINNDGWNSLIDYRKKKNNSKKRIAVIGDSYIEAFQVDYDKSYPSLLSNVLKNEYEIYSFGISGAPLSQYLHMNRYVNKTYDPEIVIINLIHNDFDESLSTFNDEKHFLKIQLDQSISEIKPQIDYSFSEFNWWKRALKKSAIVRYLFFNLKIKELLNKTANDFEANININAVQNNKKSIVRSTEYLIKTIKDENKDKSLILLMDAPRESIYNSNLSKSQALELNSMVRNMCKINNVNLIDLTQSMYDDYILNKEKFNSDYDAHWNEYGHKFIADYLIDNFFEIYK